MEYVAQLSKVSHHYKKVMALDHIDLNIPSQKMIGLIGPDGVGKSTLLALISGVLKIQHGSVIVHEKDLRIKHNRNLICPHIAYMPQGLGKNLYMTLSVYENVDFFGRLFGQSAKERQWRIKELLESTGLAPFKDRPAGKLSGGMKQKLGLCCALIHDPSLLILDEPTTGVDPLSRRQFWELIARIRSRHTHMSVIVATAYLEEAERFDWLAAMDASKILATGSPQELLALTHTDNLDAAFIRLLPESKRAHHHELIIKERPASTINTPAIEANNLTRRFGDFIAVNNVSFTIERGEIFGFLGSNGCGKTTTMKMLTGLLPVTEGNIALFGQPVTHDDLDMRQRVGFMSQAFSLYSELTVMQNLVLHAQLFHIPKNQQSERINEMLARFELQAYKNELAEQLPLGIRQRLSLAVAMIHRPDMLILDEPTSGVDPVARDAFWERLLELSRDDGVTIFVSTHFMNEAQRCDRISLMHGGLVLASGKPAQLIADRGCANLEETFIKYLEDANETNQSSQINDGDRTTLSEKPSKEFSEKNHPMASNIITKPPSSIFSWVRLLGYAYREWLEIKRDPVRLTFALLGTVLLMLVLGFGVTTDVENISFVALDYDQSPESRDYLQNISGSRYFIEEEPITKNTDIETRMQSGKIGLTIEIPPNFGKELRQNRQPEVAAWIDGANPFRAEVINSYMMGMHADYLNYLSQGTSNKTISPNSADLEVRYRYNQDYKSIYSIVPGVIPLLLVLIPSMLMALGVVREKELGSITNLYATPVTRLEFLLGKQLPYIGLAMINYFGLVLLAIFLFDVPLKGSFLALTLAAFLYVTATTGVGLLISAFTRTQIAAIFGTAIFVMMIAVQFSGLTDPVSSLNGVPKIMGQLFPTSYFMTISRGIFTKALNLSDLYREFLILAAFIPVLTLICLGLLKKQDG